MALLTYLVHVTGALVKVREGSQVGNNRQHASRVQFQMRGNTLLDLFLSNRHIHVHLLKRTQVIKLAILKISHRTHHSTPAGEEIETGVLTTLGNGDVTDFEIKRHFGVRLGLELSKPIGELFGLHGGSVTDNFTIKLGADHATTIDRGGEHLGHTLSGKESGDVGNVKE